MAKYVEIEKVQEMLENAQIITDGVNCGYCTEDVSIGEIHSDDVAPVVHAKWILKETVHIGVEEYMCSECSGDEYWEKYYCRGNEKYCPNCGAKMGL